MQTYSEKKFKHNKITIKFKIINISLNTNDKTKVLANYDVFITIAGISFVIRSIKITQFPDGQHIASLPSFKNKQNHYKQTIKILDKKLLDEFKNFIIQDFKKLNNKLVQIYLNKKRNT